MAVLGSPKQLSHFHMFLGMVNEREVGQACVTPFTSCSQAAAADTQT